MAKANQAVKASTKSRRVTIPAGKQYIVFDKGATVHLVDTDGVWPESIRKEFSEREEKAYIQGIKDGKNEQASTVVNARPRTMEETLQACLTMIRQHHGNDQNQITAVILNELGKDRENRVKAIREDIARAQELLGHAEACNNGFQEIRNGGFEKLNFR